jgi:hypothetical protein
MTEKNQIKNVTELWVKLTNKQITREWNLKQDIEEGTKAGYMTNETYRVINGEVYMKKNKFDKEYKKG